MSLTYNEAVEQTITAGEQIHQIVNGTATTEVTVEDGSKVPSIRKALLDNFYFKDPIAWQVGQTENVFNQLRQFTDGSWWYAPSATASNPISMGVTPVGDPLWKIYDFDAIGKLTPQIRESLRRSYAEAGYNVVGTFQSGFTIINANDIGIDETTGKGFMGPAGVVDAGTDPTSGGFVDASELHLFGRVVNVQCFGAVGGDIVRDNAGFKAASDFLAATGGGTLLVPKPSTGLPYLLGDIVLQCHMLGLNFPTLKNTNSANTHSGIRYNGAVKPVDNLRISKIIFDGNVSTDPVDWATGYDSFTGNTGLYLSNLTGVVLDDCKFNNAHRAGVRIESCDGVEIKSCHSKHTRGTYGDGFYVQGSTNVRCTDSSAEDFTRIGFVADLVCDNVIVSGFKAKNGHHQSRNYGGQEFNRAVWLENTNNGQILSSYAEDMEGGSFTIAFGPSTPVAFRERAFGLISKCVSKNTGELGIVVSPFSVDGDILVDTCKVYGSAVSYQVSGRITTSSSVKFRDCFGLASGSGAHSYVFASDTGSTGHLDLTIEDCKGGLETYANVTLDGSSNTADISGFFGSIGTLTIKNYKNVHNLASIKFNQIVNLYRTIDIQDTTIDKITIIANAKSKISFTNSIVKTAIIGNDNSLSSEWGTLYLNNTLLTGSFAVRGMYVRGTCDITGLGRMRFTGITPASFPRAVIDMTVNMEKNVAVDGPGLEVLISPSIVTRNHIRGVWKNTGAAVGTTQGAFFKVINTNNFFYGYGLVRDSSITDDCETFDNGTAINIHGDVSVVM